MLISQSCHLIAVLGGKGGVGKSVFAANLAASLMLELKTQVLLIDADSKSAGDQNILLNTRPQKTLAEVAQFSGSMSQQSIPQIVTQHPSGLVYIGAVRGPDESLRVSPEVFSRPLEFLSRHFKFIVVDLGNDLQDFQHFILNEATVAMMVTTPEVLVFNQTHRMLAELAAKTYPRDLFQLVINRWGPGSMDPQTIAKSLGLNLMAVLPQEDATATESLKGTPFVLGPSKGRPLAQAYTKLVRDMSGLFPKWKAQQKPRTNPFAEKAKEATVATGKNDKESNPRNLLKDRIHKELVRVMDAELREGLAKTQDDPVKEAALRKVTEGHITTILDRESPGLARDERSRLIKEISDEVLRLGPLEDLLADPSVTEIMVNGAHKIFIERNGKITTSDVTFTSEKHLKNIIDRIVVPLGRRIDEKTPYVDARLKDGSRVNAIAPPLAIDGHAVTIRKFKKDGISPETYLKYGSMTSSMIEFLKICVEQRLNIVISGGTGSGKTSLLNMLSSFIQKEHRVVTVEDAAELQLKQEHVVRLETRPATLEGSNAVTIRDLVRNALRMRPDRIIVGECRDGAALDMLQAMNTGHDGSMTTTHANSPRECLARLETLCQMSETKLPVDAIRPQIASAVNLIIQISRLSDGSRKMMSITEVIPKMQGDTITMNEIFKFKETGLTRNSKGDLVVVGEFQSTGTPPTFMEKFKAKGVKVPDDLFSAEKMKQAPAAAAAPKPTSPLPSMPTPVKKTGTGGST